MDLVVDALVRNVPLIVAVADSFQDVMNDVRKVAQLLSEHKGECKFMVWTPNDTIPLTNVLKELKNYRYPTILVVRDFFGQVLSNPFYVQALASYAEEPAQARVLVVTQRPETIPPEIETRALLVKYPLPDESSLKEIVRDIAKKADIPIDVDSVNVEALYGLTREQAISAVLLSLEGDKNRVVSNEKKIAEAKKQITRIHPALNLIPPEEIQPIRLYGYEPVLDFVKKSIFVRHRKKYLSKGIVLAGVPGNGKTTFAMQVAKELNLPLLVFDPSLCYSPYVGESERMMQRALDVIDRMGRKNCIVLIDEVEKGLSFGGGDSGVSMRVFGKFLSWFGTTSEVRPFIIATSNELSLPPEFYRRFDMIVFVDLPDSDLRREIFDYYVKYYELPKEHYEDFDVEARTDGWTGEEIEKLVRFAKMLSTHVEDAMEFVTPISKVKKEEIENMRNYATKMQAYVIPVKKRSEGGLSIGLR